MSAPIVWLVIGPCGAGKTTWIRDHCPENKWTIEYEALLDAVQCGRRSYTPTARTFGRVLWQAAVAHVVARQMSCAIEIGGATARERSQVLCQFARWHREIVALVPDPAVAVARAMRDPLRPRTTRWGPIVARWYARYEIVRPAEADRITILS